MIFAALPLLLILSAEAVFITDIMIVHTVWLAGMRALLHCGWYFLI